MRLFAIGDIHGRADLLLGLDAIAGLDTHFLMGNHERTLLDFLADSQVGPTWGMFDGRADSAAAGKGVAPLAADQRRRNTHQPSRLA